VYVKREFKKFLGIKKAGYLRTPQTDISIRASLFTRQPDTRANKQTPYPVLPYLPPVDPPFLIYILFQCL
jgi:hypothetical protein